MCFLNVLSFFSSSETQWFQILSKLKTKLGSQNDYDWHVRKTENSVKTFPTIQEYNQCQNFLNLKLK